MNHFRLAALTPFFWASLASADNGAGIDCKRAASSVEKFICREEVLLATDRKMGREFQELKSHPKGRLAVSPQELIKNQKEWLQERDNCLPHNGEPSNEAKNCLINLYASRFAELSFPGAPKELTQEQTGKLAQYFKAKSCEEVQPLLKSSLLEFAGFEEVPCKLAAHSPRIAARIFAGCYGSTMDNFTPSCDAFEKAMAVKGLPELLRILQALYGEDSSSCGTIRYGHYRNQNTAVLLALYDTKVSLESALEPPELDSNGTPSSPYPASLNEEEFDPPKNPQGISAPILQNFSWQGLWENRAYSKFQEVSKAARAGLIEYYVHDRGVPQKEAEAAARFHLANLVNAYVVGHHSSERYWSPQTVQKFLRDGTLPSRASLEYQYQYPNSLRPYASEATVRSASLALLLKLAVLNGFTAADIQKLLQSGASAGPSPMKDTALMAAAQRPEILKILLDAGAEVNAQNEFGKTALMYAIQYGDLEAVKLLIERGANVNLPTTNPPPFGDCNIVLSTGGRTPLMYAAWHAAPEVKDFLLKRGASPEAKDSEGNDYHYYETKNDFRGSSLSSDSQRK